MEREVRYCTTKDGVRIAFTVTGSGPPLVYMPQPCMTTIQAGDEIEEARSFVLRLEQSFQLIRYDSRGCGLSTRNVDAFDVEALARDVEAIVDKLALDEYFIWAEFDSGPPAILLAHRHRNASRDSSFGVAG